MVKQHVFAILMASALSGCANYVWVGQNPQADMNACNAEANRAYPPAIYSYQSSPGYTTPVRTSCNSNGWQTNCISTGGQYIPPTQSLADANDGNRKAHFNNCMVSRGNRLMDESDYRKTVTTAPQQMNNPRSQCSGGKYSPAYDPKICE